MSAPILTAGQTLWYVPEQWVGRVREGREVTVKSVARTWATLTNGERIHKLTLAVDGKGFTPPAQCFLSRQVYEEHKRAQIAWSALYRRMHSKPHFVTEADIRRAAELLGITLGVLP